MCGTPIDLKQVTADIYSLAGTNDHITPWQSCYKSAQLFGGKVEFVLSSSGHIQSILNPPGNPKARYQTGEGLAGGSRLAWSGRKMRPSTPIHGGCIGKCGRRSGRAN